MAHDDPATKDATKKPPERGVRSFLRTGSAPSLALILVAGLVGCTNYEFAFGPSSGSLHYEGSDPMGAFSGDVSAWDCQGRFEEGGSTSAFFSGARKHDVIMLLDGGLSIHISTHGGGWTVDRSTCRAFDVRKWFDAEKHLHVVVVLDDCTTRDGVRVQGRVRSDACYVNRPH